MSYPVPPFGEDRMFRLRPLLALLFVAVTLASAAPSADAAPRMSAGSRGMRTFSEPPPTATAPNVARPIERTMTQPPPAVRPVAPVVPNNGGFLNRPGLLGGFAAGFLGAGLFGMLFGNGLVGGLGGMASFFGLLLQIGLVVIVSTVAWRWWQRRSQPAAAFAGVPTFRVAPKAAQPAMNFSGVGSAPNEVRLEVKPQDFDVFERLLGEIQTAYGIEDLAALRQRMTPEMLSYYAEELAKNAGRGVVNQLSNVKLLQGDLAEAWCEADDQYATVAMRYSLDDRMVNRANGRVVEDTSGQQLTELWTFRRALGGNWVLSALQQA
jgi:predicted lipid-binding transport protein (Tim44 family)